MRHQKISHMLYAGALAACLLASCTQEEDGIPGGASRAPLTVGAVFLAGGAQTTPGATPGTRATVLPTPVVTGTLWAGIRSDNGYTARTGLIYTYAGGKWTCPTAVELGKDPVSLYAYWPQDIYPEAGGRVTLTTQPYADNKVLGYALSGGGNVCSVHPAAGFVLKHAYARIKVDITFAQTFVDNMNRLNFVSVTAGGFLSTGTLLLESGTVIPLAASPKLEWVSETDIDELGGLFTGDMLVVPSASVAYARLVVSIDGVKHIADLTGLTKLESGKSYLIKARVDTDPALKITSVVVEDWIPSAPQSGDTQFE